jgi:AraC-like DNA-binding protein
VPRTAQKRSAGRALTYAPFRRPSHGWRDGRLPIWHGHHDHSDAPITSLHRHDLLELGYCFEGSGIFVIEDKVRPFSAGCATVITAREHHLAQSAPGTTSRWSWILFDPAEIIADPRLDRRLLDLGGLSGARFPNVFEPGRWGVLCDLVRLLAEELRADRPGAADAARGLVWAILAQLRRLPRTPATGRGAERAGAMERVAPAIELIGKGYAEELDLPRLARACRLSEPSLRRNFQAAVAMSPKRYLLRFRVHQAAALLRAEPRRPILDVSLACGFASLSAFNRHFKSELGVSPRQWRKAAG